MKTYRVTYFMPKNAKIIEEVFKGRETEGISDLREVSKGIYFVEWIVELPEEFVNRNRMMLKHHLVEIEETTPMEYLVSNDPETWLRRDGK